MTERFPFGPSTRPECPPWLWLSGFADRLDGAGQIGQGGGDGNQPVSFTLHGLFSHSPSLDKQQVSKYSQHQAIGGRLRFWNRSFKASCSSPWTVFLSWAASTRSCW